ncbi:hypothetical protein JG688_00002926 [Phytophthora aleatoria]|uniref:Uncharacterized protein n=1 Tax=Phytophthora aleatoria TaxID=2496075 RepID=A0A8J5M8D0_9STRA|nr:hypothetical protein JG688_00002926 [Phytophthora aleatoria]
MKRKLEDASQTAADSGTNLVKTIMILRADAERAEAARARRLEERRVEREAAEDRRREDRTEARQHIQDMLMMIAALQNGTMPGVRL